MPRFELKLFHVADIELLDRSNLGRLQSTQITFKIHGSQKSLKLFPVPLLLLRDRFYANRAGGDFFLVQNVLVCPKTLFGKWNLWSLLMAGNNLRCDSYSIRHWLERITPYGLSFGYGIALKFSLSVFLLLCLHKIRHFLDLLLHHLIFLLQSLAFNLGQFSHPLVLHDQGKRLLTLCFLVFAISEKSFKLV